MCEHALEVKTFTQLPSDLKTHTLVKSNMRPRVFWKSDWRCGAVSAAWLCLGNKTFYCLFLNPCFAAGWLSGIRPRWGCLFPSLFGPISVRLQVSAGASTHLFLHSLSSHVFLDLPLLWVCVEDEGRSSQTADSRMKCVCVCVCVSEDLPGTSLVCEAKSFEYDV